MPKLEVFFDYTCPFCLRGHGFLIELLPRFPDVTAEWAPCEAHPRPEHYGTHSDLCARGMYYALEHGADLMEYHGIMYNAALASRADIEDLGVVAGLLQNLLDSGAFYTALSGGAYIDKLDENNRLAWETYGFPAVPSYRMNGSFLKSTVGVGVSKQQLSAFLEQQAGYSL